MADSQYFIVSLLTTSAIIICSFLFWKWNKRRQQHVSEQRMHSRISRADVRKNRLKRFDIAGNKIYSKSSSGLEASSVTEEKQLLSEDKPFLNDLKRLDKDSDGSPVLEAEGGGKFEGGAASILGPETRTSDHSMERWNDVKKQSPSKAKPERFREWVTLSVTDAAEVNVPVTRPLTTLEELRSWSEGFDEFNRSTVPLRRTLDAREKRPRTLVCHDMKGGYLEDRFVQGYPSADCYRIWHWQYIDIFVYFSHNFITIPPPCWTNSAHQHGVQVLGTFITEWEDGAKRCAEIFIDQYSYQAVANQLVCIAKYYEFDGWLINIENAIQPAQVNNLTEFLNYLTSEMHQKIPGSLVIWYDSVTYKGELKWQNELNPDNRIFFDVSDGMFLNYGWNETNLTMSAKAAGQERRHDVYVGVDVFGRGCFGGGGWNTNMATRVIKKHDLSLALFAPGWVYENYPSTFQVSQDKFWTSVAADCTIHALEPSLPFVTSFCQGYGDKVFKNGQVILDKPWTHLSAEQLQPSYTNHIYSLGDQHGVYITSMGHSCLDAYNGGGCWSLKGSTKMTQTTSKAVVRLFKSDLLLPSTTVFTFTTKLQPHDTLNVALQVHVDKKPTYIMLCPAAELHVQDPQDANVDSLNQALLQRYGVTRSTQLSLDHLAMAVGQEHYRLFAPLTGDHHKKLQNMCSVEDENKNLDSPWCTRYYLLAEKDLKGSRVKEIRLVLMNKTTKELPRDASSIEFQLFVGEVKILDAVSLRRPLPTVTSLHCCESELKVQTKPGNMITLSLTLSWSYNNTNTDPWQRFEVYHNEGDGSITFLGLAFAMSFVVSNLDIPRSQNQVSFIVQAIDCAQRRQSLEDCPTITIHWS